MYDALYGALLILSYELAMYLLKKTRVFLIVEKF